MNESGTEFIGADAIVQDVVKQHVSALASCGFTFMTTSLGGSKALGHFPVFVFDKKSHSMQLRIVFKKSQQQLNGGFIVSLISQDGRRLDVEKYLEIHGHNQYLPGFTYKSDLVDVRTYADTFLKTLESILKNELKSIVDGAAFEETPIDWMGYK